MCSTIHIKDNSLLHIWTRLWLLYAWTTPTCYTKSQAALYSATVQENRPQNENNVMFKASYTKVVSFTLNENKHSLFHATKAKLFCQRGDIWCTILSKGKLSQAKLCCRQFQKCWIEWQKVSAIKSLYAHQIICYDS